MEKPKRNTRLLRRWIAALRSGKYKQTTRQLTREGKFCCLGVACEISGAGKWNGDRFDLLNTPQETFGGGEYDLMPGELWESMNIPLTQQDLSLKNDLEGWSFKRIATFIERSAGLKRPKKKVGKR